jgi:hypothetical protein
MNTLPKHPLSVFGVLKATLMAYFKIFPKIMLLVAISSIGHLIIPPLARQNLAFAAVAAIAFIFLTWFLYTAIISRAKVTLLGGEMRLTEAFRLAKRRYLSILGSNIIFFAIGALLMLIIFALNLIFDLINLHPVFLVLSILLSVIILVYLYFAIPEIALEKITTVHAFEKSVRIVRHHWWRTFIVLALIGAAILGFEALGILFTGKDRMVLFTSYHFALQLFFYPLIIAATIILLNDLKLRMEDKQRFTKHSAGHHRHSLQ